MIRTLTLTLCAAAFSLGAYQPVTIIPGTDTGGNIGYAIGSGLAARNARYRQQIQELKEIKLRTKLNRYALEMIVEYQPSRHNEFVECILRSALPSDEKLIIIQYFTQIKEKEKT